MTEFSLLKQALALIEEKKGEDAVVIDLREESIPTSFFLITHGDNTVHVKAIVSHLRQNMPKKNMYREGIGERRWVILDYGEIVVHIFSARYPRVL